MTESNDPQFLWAEFLAVRGELVHYFSQEGTSDVDIATKLSCDLVQIKFIAQTSLEQFRILSDPRESDFQEKLSSLINAESREGRSDTPDFILAQYMSDALKAYEKAINRRDDWYKGSGHAQDPEARG